MEPENLLLIENQGFEVPLLHSHNKGSKSRGELETLFPDQRRDLICPDCGGKLVLKDGKFGIFYGCENWDTTGCTGAHGCYKKNAEPYGIPANAETRQLRKLLLSKMQLAMEKDESNTLDLTHSLSNLLNVPMGRAKVAYFDRTQCEVAIQFLDLLLYGPTRYDRILAMEGGPAEEQVIRKLIDRAISVGEVTKK